MNRWMLRPEIQDFKPYSPGLSIDEIKKRFNLSRVIKMASNENPLGTSPLVQRVLKTQAGCSFRYPRPGSPDLTRALAHYHGLPPEAIVVGNGSDEIIDLCIRATARPDTDNIVICQPSFSIYRMQTRLCGVELRSVRLNDDFSFPFHDLLHIMDDQTRLVFITNPDNPSGYAAGVEQILNFASQLPKNCLLVLDEAYMEFAQPQEQFSPVPVWSKTYNICCLRTFSKMYGLAGLRLGYGIMPPWLAEALLKVKLPFSVNILAEQAGMAALEDSEFQTKTLETVTQGRKFLHKELERLKCSVFPSQSNFLMFRPPAPASHIFNHLLSQGLIIRPLDSYGLPDLIRVTIGNNNENKLFIHLLEKFIHSYEQDPSYHHS
jgi:histidinol-phosphate aminotransferase